MHLFRIELRDDKQPGPQEPELAHSREPLIAHTQQKRDAAKRKRGGVLSQVLYGRLGETGLARDAADRCGVAAINGREYVLFLSSSSEVDNCRTQAIRNQRRQNTYLAQKLGVRKINAPSGLQHPGNFLPYARRVLKMLHYASSDHLVHRFMRKR